MGIAAVALDRYADNTYSVTGKENYTGVEETSKSFGWVAFNYLKMRKLTEKSSI